MLYEKACSCVSIISGMVEQETKTTKAVKEDPFKEYLPYAKDTPFTAGSFEKPFLEKIFGKINQLLRKILT